MIVEIDLTTKSLIDGIRIMLDHVNAENEELRKKLKLHKKEMRESNDVYVDQLKRITELEEFVGRVRDDDNHITEDTELHTFCIYCEAEKLLPRGKKS